MAMERTVHEPEAELLSAEDAIQDAERLHTLFRRNERAQQPVALQVPLSVFLDAIDRLDTATVRQIARRAEERLATEQDVA